MAFPKKKAGGPVPPMPPPLPKKLEPVPGMLATRHALKGMRADSLRHIPKKGCQ